VAERLANQPTNPIAGDRIADRFRADGQAEARQVHLVGAKIDAEKGIANALAGPVDRLEVAFGSDAQRGWKNQPVAEFTGRVAAGHVVKE